MLQDCNIGLDRPKCSSNFDSLSIESASLLSILKEEWFRILEIMAKSSSLVTPWWISYSICLQIFVKLPYFLWFLRSQLLASADSPFAYFRMVFSTCSTCHCLIGKLLCTKMNQILYSLITYNLLDCDFWDPTCSQFLKPSILLHTLSITALANCNATCSYVPKPLGRGS